MDEADELFEVRNYFLIGNYQGAINECQQIPLDDDFQKIERDAYLYRSYIAQGNYQLVLDELENTNSPSLQCIRLLSLYFASPDKSSVLDKLKEGFGEGGNNYILPLIGGIIYKNEGLLEESLKMLHQSNHLECTALTLQIYIEMGRIDLAEKELFGMQKIDEYATITQLANAWLDLAMGGEKIQEAFFIFQELHQKFSGSTPLLLNSMAVCQMILKNFTAAESLLLQSLDKNNKDSDTVINLISCAQHMRKPNDIITRYTNQLKQIGGESVWVQNHQSLLQSFDDNAAKYVK